MPDDQCRGQLPLAAVAVHLTRIYTRTGDEGTTALGDMSRVAKTDLRVSAYADCDEANTAIGVAMAIGNPPGQIGSVLRRLQNDLFDVGADLATPPAPDPARSQLRINADYVARVEAWCDQFNADLPNLTSFVLPGGSPLAALLHVARAVVRRAERSAWALHEQLAESGGAVNPATLRYLNRLSDLLFILARVANPDGDVLWHPGG